MEEEKSNIEILKEFSANTNRKIVWKEEQYPLSSYRQFPRYRRSVYISNDKSNTVFYVLYSDPYYNIGEDTVFCGAFLPLQVKLKGKIRIRKRNIFDRLRLFKKTINANFLSSRFLSKAVVSYEYEADLHQLLQNVTIQDRLLESLGKSYINVLSINEFDVDFVPELAGKSCLGIVNPQIWELEDEEIERYFSIAEKIRTIL